MLLDRNNNAAILLAGILALVVGVGVARFAFTSLLPAMLDNYLSIAFAGVLASINYVGYLSGSIFAIFINDGVDNNTIIKAVSMGNINSNSFIIFLKIGI